MLARTIYNVLSLFSYDVQIWWFEDAKHRIVYSPMQYKGLTWCTKHDLALHERLSTRGGLFNAAFDTRRCLGYCVTHAKIIIKTRMHMGENGNCNTQNIYVSEE